MSLKAGARLLTAAGQDADAIYSSAESGQVEIVEVNGSASVVRNSNTSDSVFSPNVLAYLEGSDPVLKNEFVVVTAHLDHVGVAATDDLEDGIYNGALDNAAGSAVVLELARVFSELAQAGFRPRRSILFTLLTAEEKGLQGAEYFNAFPTVPTANMVANVNLDMPLVLYDFTDLIAFGAERSSLGPVTETAVAKIGVTLSPDPLPEEGLFTRSDHYEFVKKGIPSVFLMTGFGQSLDGQSGEKVFRDFLANTYHTPADQLDLPINYQVGAKFSYANWMIITAVANADERPTWNNGDFFGETFGRK